MVVKLDFFYYYYLLNWMWCSWVYVLFCVNRLVWWLCLMILFLLIIRILFVCLMVDKWCVIISMVLFFCSLFNVVWMVCFDLVFSVDVVLLRISIGVLCSNVWVIVICWCWLLDKLVLFLLIMVFKFCGMFLINFIVWVWCVVCLICLWVYLFLVV